MDSAKQYAWGKATIRALGITVAAFAVMAAVGALVNQVSASPAACGSCHEMQAKIESWEVSGHTVIGCPDCHEADYPWHRLPQRLWARGVKYKNDISAHVARSNDDTSSLEGGARVEMPDSVCLRCHNPDRDVSLRFGTLIDHPEHSRRNKSCVSCHLWTGHPDTTWERSLALMDQCYTCHGRETDSVAPGTCDVCHPEEFHTRPDSHEPAAEWQDRHSAAALPDVDKCAMCHDDDYCGDCHGIDMPHPENWIKGGTEHGPVAITYPLVCETCHPTATNYCNNCHHPGHEPQLGSWEDQHPDLVSERGASYCLECHHATHCHTCHTEPRELAQPGTSQ